MALLRSYIPLDVRLRVVMRQLTCGQELIEETVAKAKRTRTVGVVLADRLAQFANQLGVLVKQLHLDHDPALENRQKVYRHGHAGLREHIGYIPDELSPDHLFYRVGGYRGSEHDIKTRVRGERGQFADNVIAKRERKRQRRLTKPKRKHKWASRPLRSRNDLRKKPRRHK